MEVEQVKGSSPQPCLTLDGHHQAGAVATTSRALGYREATGQIAALPWLDLQS